MKPTSIILSEYDDINAAALQWSLQHSGGAGVWCETAGYADPRLAGISFSISDQEELKLESKLALDQVRSVWFRRARPAKHFPNARACDQGFLENQWSALHRNINQTAPSLTSALWVNAPEAAQQGENKVHQLRIAKRVGFKIPDTLISNDPVQIGKFLARHPQVIYKTFAPHLWQNETQMHVAHARLIQRDQVIDPRSLAIAPGIFQSFVNKTADLRVTVIGQRLFAMQLNSKQGHAFVDWRSHTKEASFQAQAIELTGALQAKILKFMQSMNLVYGCIDLVVDANQEIYFLEVNQGGQFLFAERWVRELPLLRAMTALLLTGNVQYSLSQAAPIDYNGFLASDAYQQWCEDCAKRVAITPLEEPYFSKEAA
jgi:hypothetical protein